MINLEHVDSLVQKSNRRFFLFSFLAIAVVALVSIVSLHYHRNLIRQQTDIQRLQRILTSQLVDILEIARVAKTFNEDLADDERKQRRLAFLSLIDQLKEEKRKLTLWVNSSQKQEFFFELQASLKKAEIEKQIEQYLNKAEELVQSNQAPLNEVWEDIDFLQSSSTTLLSDLFRDLEGKVLQVQKSVMTDVNRMGVILVLLCVLEVVLVWAIVFKPLYSAILRQHERLTEAVLQAESASRSKTDFLANISHEIRTPMTAILGHSELIARQKTVSAKEAKETAAMINQNATHLLSLIDEILDVSKIEAGKLDVIKEPVDLSQTLNEVFSLINVKAEEKNLDLKFTNAGKVPKYIESDPKRLKQILFNIIGNAIKFTDKGFVHLSVSMERIKSKKKLIFRIKDSGRGISKQELKRLFKPFSQADTSLQRKHGGTGLGLVLSQTLAQKMGGNLWVEETTKGRGTTFTIAVDPGKAAESTKNTISELSTHLVNPQDEKALSNENDMPLEKRKILVVDDAKENAQIFKLYLEAVGADIELAHDGNEALDKAFSNDFDVVLLDLQMPEKDGYQVIHELKAGGYSAPILALTAHAMSEDIERTKKAGFSAHIVKPVQADQLIQTVSEFCNS